MKRETRDLLKKRAAIVAKESEQKNAATKTIELIVFTLAAETYGIESSFVREIYPLKDFTPLPGVPPFILGLIHVRRQILAVIDLKKFLNIQGPGLGNLNKVIVLQDNQMEFGILADVVIGSQTIENENIKQSPPTVSGSGEEYLMGVTKERLIVLDAAILLADKSIVINDEAPF